MQEEDKMPFAREGATMERLADGGLCLRLAGGTEQIIYPVFPGVRMIYNDIALGGLALEPGEAREVLEIDHCREGCLRCGAGERAFSLRPGDVAFHRAPARREECFPEGRYRGLTVQIDLRDSSGALVRALEDVEVEPAQLAEKFRLGDNGCFVLRQLPGMAHLFAELYSVPPVVAAGYRKLKVLELLLFLKGLEPGAGRREMRRVPESQQALVRAVCAYVDAHPEEPETLSSLAARFSVSPSLLKSSFDGVCGMPVQSFLRGRKMRAAAKLLRESDRTVLDIAGQFGYANASKFAAAFRSVMGVSPTLFRKERNGAASVLSERKS